MQGKVRGCSRGRAAPLLPSPSGLFSCPLLLMLVLLVDSTTHSLSPPASVLPTPSPPFLPLPPLQRQQQQQEPEQRQQQPPQHQPQPRDPHQQQLEHHVHQEKQHLHQEPYRSLLQEVGQFYSRFLSLDWLLISPALQQQKRLPPSGRALQNGPPLIYAAAIVLPSRKAQSAAGARSTLLLPQRVSPQGLYSTFTLRRQRPPAACCLPIAGGRKPAVSVTAASAGKRNSAVASPCVAASPSIAAASAKSCGPGATAACGPARDRAASATAAAKQQEEQEEENAAAAGGSSSSIPRNAGASPVPWQQRHQQVKQAAPPHRVTRDVGLGVDGSGETRCVDGETRETGSSLCVEEKASQAISSLCSSDGECCPPAKDEGEHSSQSSSSHNRGTCKSRWLLQPVRVHAPLGRGDASAAAAANGAALQFFSRSSAAARSALGSAAAGESAAAPGSAACSTAAKAGAGDGLLRRVSLTKQQQQQRQRPSEQEQQGELLVPLDDEQPVKVVLSRSVLRSLLQAAWARSSGSDPPQAALLYGRVRQQSPQLPCQSSRARCSSRISSRGVSGGLLAAAAEEQQDDEEEKAKTEKKKQQQPVEIRVEGVLLLCCSAEEKAAAAAVAARHLATSSAPDRQEAESSLAAALPALAVLGAKPKLPAATSQADGAEEDAAAAADYSPARDAADRTACHLGLQLVGWAALRPPPHLEEQEQEPDDKQQQRPQQQERGGEPGQQLQQRRQVSSRFLSAAAAAPGDRGARRSVKEPNGEAASSTHAATDAVHNLDLLVTLELQAQLQQQQRQKQQQKEGQQQEGQQEDGRRQDGQQQRNVPLVGLLVRRKGLAEGSGGIEIEAYTPTANCWRIGMHSPQLLPTAREQLEQMLPPFGASDRPGVGAGEPPAGSRRRGGSSGPDSSHGRSAAGWASSRSRTGGVSAGSPESSEEGKLQEEKQSEDEGQQKDVASAAAAAGAPLSWGGRTAAALRRPRKGYSAWSSTRNGSRSGAAADAESRGEDAAAAALWGVQQQQLKQPICIDGVPFSSLPLAFLYRYLPVVAAEEEKTGDGAAAAGGREGGGWGEGPVEEQENFFLFEEAPNDDDVLLADAAAGGYGAAPPTTAKKKRLVRSQVVSCSRGGPAAGHEISTRLQEVLHARLSPEAVGQELLRSFELLQQVASLLPHNDADFQVLCRALTNQAARRKRQSSSVHSSRHSSSSNASIASSTDVAEDTSRAVSSSGRSTSPRVSPDTAGMLQAGVSHREHQGIRSSASNTEDCKMSSDTSARQTAVPESVAAATGAEEQVKTEEKAKTNLLDVSASQQAEADAADVARVLRLLRVLTMPSLNFHLQDEEDTF